MDIRETFAFCPVPPVQFVVDRRTGSGPQVMTLTHKLHMPLFDQDGNPRMRGPLLGFGFQDERGFQLYAQPEHCTPVTP